MADIVFHNHRIIPGHMGGTYAPRNVVRCNVAMHAFLHRVLWEQHGYKQDLQAWQMLTWRIGRDTTELEAARIKASNEASKLWWADPANAAKMVAITKERWATDPSYRAKMSSLEVRAKVRAAHLGSKAIDRTKAKMSASTKEQWANDPKYRSLMTERMKGNTLGAGWVRTEATRAKMSAAMMGNKYGVGRKWTPTPETRERMRLAAQARAKWKRDMRGH